MYSDINVVKIKEVLDEEDEIVYGIWSVVFIRKEFLLLSGIVLFIEGCLLRKLEDNCFL